MYVCDDTLVMTTHNSIFKVTTMKKENNQEKIISPRTRECAQEFATWVQGSKLLLTAFAPVLKDAKEMRQINRLNSRMCKVLQSDPVHGCGERTVAAGDVSLLQGFEFFERRPLLQLLFAPFFPSINRKKGLCRLEVPPFDAAHQVGYEGSYTHVVFITAAAVLDFDRGTFEMTMARSPYLDRQYPMGADLTVEVPARSKLPIVQVVGLEFYKEVNRQYYRMAMNGPLSLRVVQTDSMEFPQFDNLQGFTWGRPGQPA